MAMPIDFLDLPKRGGMGTFIDKTTDPLSKKEQTIGIEFIQWIQEALEKGEILLNHPPLHTVPGGLLIGIEAFKHFIREHPEFKNWHLIQQGLISLNIHKIGEHNTAISRFKEGNGIVIKGSIALPDQLFVQNEDGHHKRKADTMKMLLEGKPAQLSENGLWIAENQTSTIAPMAKGTQHG